MSGKRRLSLMVDDELFDAIECARGDVARERWLRRAVEAALRDPAERWRRAEAEVEERFGLKPPASAEPPLGAAPEIQRAVSREMSRRHAPNCKCPVCV